MFEQFRNTAIAIARDQRGVAATEYAIIAALIAVVAAGAVATVGGEMSNQYSDVESAVRSAGEG